MLLDDILKFGATIVSGSIQAGDKILGHMQVDGSFELSPDGVEWASGFKTTPAEATAASTEATAEAKPAASKKAAKA